MLDANWATEADERALERRVGDLQAGGPDARDRLPAVVVGGGWGAVLLVLFGVPWAGLAVGAAGTLLWLLWRFLPQLERAGIADTGLISRREGAVPVLPTPVRPSDPGADHLLSVTATAQPAGRVVVEAVGEVDSYTAPLLELCLDSRAAQPVLRELVVDLTRVTFLGAAGMAVLAEAGDRCRRRGARLVVLGGHRRAAPSACADDPVTVRPRGPVVCAG